MGLAPWAMATGKSKVRFQGILRLSKTICSNTKNITSMRVLEERVYYSHHIIK